MSEWPSTNDQAAPLDFVCRRCGACCRWEGEVRISPAEIEAAAGLIGVSPESFIATFTQVTRDRRGLTLIERPDGACIFYIDDPPGCRIYEARPEQCRTFPRGWNFPDWQDLCAGGGGEWHPPER
jgi:Fe-S-cluster containining protein